MLIYFFFILTPVVMHFFVKEKKQFRNVMVFACFLLVSLRSMTVGGDLQNYYIRYKTIYSYSIASGKSAGLSEPLFFLLNKLCGVISEGSFHFYIIVCAALFSILYSYAIYLLSNTQWLSWYLTVSFSVLVYALSGLRSSFGLVYGLICIYFLSKYVSNPIRKNIVYAFFFSVLGTLHHYSAIIYLVIIPLYFLRIKHKKIYYFTLSLLIGFFSIWGSKITAIMKDLFFSSKVYSESSGRGFAMLLIFLLMIIALRIFINRDKKDNRYNLLMCLLELSFTIQVLAFSFSLWVRVSQFTLIASLIMIPDYIEETYYTKKSKTIIKTLLCVFFFGWYALSLINDTASIVPYDFFWNNTYLIR